MFLDATGPHAATASRATCRRCRHERRPGRSASARCARRWRTPEALLPTLFIPLFFLVVNVGQAAKIFPSASTEFLHGQGYGAFQLPSSLLLAASFGTAALFLVEDIEGGYFDKLARDADLAHRARARPAHRRVASRRVLIAVAIVLLAPVVRHLDRERGRSASCCSSLLTALWAVVFVGFMQLIALKTRSAAATQLGGLIFFPLLFLTPNFVPRDLLTRPMEIAATLNPVTYVMEAMRSLILDDLDWDTIVLGFARRRRARRVMLVLNVRVIERYD